MILKLYNKIALKCVCCMVLFCSTLAAFAIFGQNVLEPYNNRQLMLFSGIIISLIAAATLIVVHNVISRPLKDLADQLAQFDPSKQYTAAKTSQKTSQSKDEVDLLIASFNDMQKKVTTAYRSLSISEHKTLLQEKDLLIEAADYVPLVIIIANNENRIQYVNIGAERLSGYKRSELVGRNTAMFAESMPSTKLTLKKIGEEIGNGKQWEGVIECRSRSGKPLTLFSIVSPVLDNNGNVTNTISVSREISYELGLQDELMNARKMEAVGRLASNFAHEFGNPLFGIRSVITDFCSREDISEGDKQLLEIARDECDRMKVMVKEFQLLYQGYAVDKQVHNIHRIIENVLEDIYPIVESNKVQFSIQFTDYDRRIRVDKGGLSLVLKNILVNAIESMAGKNGGITISTEVGGNYFYIMLEDKGTGIKGKHQELVFEPFFSTKPAVQGAGLGLSVAFATMKKLGGSITFESKEGEGTLFTVLVPLGLQQQKTA